MNKETVERAQKHHLPDVRHGVVADGKQRRTAVAGSPIATKNRC